MKCIDLRRGEIGQGSEDLNGYFDEMFGRDGAVLGHYEKLHNAFAGLTREEFAAKRRSVDLAFLRQGVTFNVYGDSRGAERIFPFDVVPRIIPAREWEYLERGLVQRITALNLFLHDIYHEQRILKDGAIPSHYILSGKHFRREFVNFAVPKDIYIPGAGWQALDPTHNRQPDETYVKIGVGRDYGDVAPVRGNYTGTTQRTMNVEVRIERRG